MKVLSWHDSPQESVMESLIVLKRGGFIVYPTDTVYGIGADPMQKVCVEYINRLKGRDTDEPISVCIPSFEWLAEKVDKKFIEVARMYLPGPYTLLIPAKVSIPAMGRSDLLGVRMVNHPYVQSIVERFGPITSTSANLHGMPPPARVKDAISQLMDRVDLYIDGGDLPGRASTIISLENETIKVIRE